MATKVKTDALYSTIFPTGKIVDDPTHTTLADIIGMVRSGSQKSRTNWIRECIASGGADDESAKEAKVQLPVAVFAGQFSKRNNASCKSYSGLVVLDVDDLEDPEAARDTIAGDEHIACCFISPSGTGIKPVLFTNARSVEDHAAAVMTATKYMADRYRLKASSAQCDVSRACFLCHDAGAWIQTEVAPLPVDRSLAPPKAAVGEGKLGPLPDGQISENRHGHFLVTAARLAGMGMHPPEIKAALLAMRARTTREVAEDEIDRMVIGAVEKYHDRDLLADAARRLAEAETAPDDTSFFFCDSLPDPVRTLEEAVKPELSMPAADLLAGATGYREPLIDGLLRMGETMNVIAAPKTGKSWLVLQLAYSVGHGIKWMGRNCTKGTVLLVDNELHKETLRERLRGVSRAMGVDAAGMHVMSLRGRLKSLDEMRFDIIEQANRVGATMIIFDALYRMIAKGVSENDNAGMMSMYNTLDQIAEATGAACVCVHHSSKGNQSEKSVTDGGAGAGSISRAADAHLFLREHEEDGVVSVDAVARSWPKPEPFCIAFDGIWHLEGGADPARLKKVSRGQGKAAVVPVAEIVARLPQRPVPLKLFIGDCSDACGCTKLAVEQAISKAEALRDAVVLTGKNRAKTIVAASGDYSEMLSGTATERVREYLREHPEAHAKDAAMACECDPSVVRRVRNE